MWKAYGAAGAMVSRRESDAEPALLAVSGAAVESEVAGNEAPIGVLIRGRDQRAGGDSKMLRSLHTRLLLSATVLPPRDHTKRHAIRLALIWKSF